MNFDFSVDFSLTYCLLTVASFRIGVPSILFLIILGDYDVPNFEKDRFDGDKYVYHSSLLRTFDFSVISTPYSYSLSKNE